MGDNGPLPVSTALGCFGGGNGIIERNHAGRILRVADDSASEVRFHNPTSSASHLKANNPTVHVTVAARVFARILWYAFARSVAVAG
jgi:hypothetical protein